MRWGDWKWGEGDSRQGPAVPVPSPPGGCASALRSPPAQVPTVVIFMVSAGRSERSEFGVQGRCLQPPAHRGDPSICGSRARGDPSVVGAEPKDHPELVAARRTSEGQSGLNGNSGGAGSHGVPQRGVSQGLPAGGAPGAWGPSHRRPPGQTPASAAPRPVRVQRPRQRPLPRRLPTWHLACRSHPGPHFPPPRCPPVAHSFQSSSG